MIVTNVDGHTLSYHVVETETLQLDKVDEMKHENYGLTLFACTFGGAARVTVRYELDK